MDENYDNPDDATPISYAYLDNGGFIIIPLDIDYLKFK